MMDALARIISWLFLPLFVPLYALLLVLFVPSKPSSFLLSDSLYHYPVEIKSLYLLLFSVFITLAPGLSLLVLKLNRSISSLEMQSRVERQKPIAIMTFYCIVLFLFLIYQKNSAMVPAILKGTALGGALASGIAYFINRKIKISLHSIGMGSLAGFIFMYFLSMEEYELYVLAGVFILGGIVMSSRMYLKSHNLSELGLGYFLGFISQMICIFLFTSKLIQL